MTKRRIWTKGISTQAAAKAGIGFTAAAILSACGGGGGGSSSPAPQDPVASGSISGTASKGIVSAGLVSAFTIANGVQSAAAIANATTDGNGDYTITLPNTYSGEPLVITIEAGQDTRMACDIAAGCGLDASGNAISFGDAYPLASSFSLSAIVAGAVAGAGEVTANLTPLTTTSTEIALATIDGLGVVSTFNVAEAIANANSQVAMRFGFTGDVTMLPVVDLTDPAEVAAAIASDASAVEYAAINAAIVSAVQADAATAGSPVDIETAISNFVDDFATAGISDNSIDPELTDLGDILAEAQDVLSEVEDELTDAGLTDALSDLADLDSDLAAEESMANLETPTDDGDQGTPSETAAAAALAKVKNLVEQVRDLGAFIEVAEVGESNPTDTVASALDNFDLQVDAADLASSDSAEQAAEALGLVVEAVVEVYDLNFDIETGLPLAGSEIATSGTSTFNGIAVDYADVQGTAVFTVDQDVTVPDFVSTAAVNTTFSLPSISFTEVCDGAQDIEVGGIVFTDIDNCEFNASASLMITGSAVADDVTMTVNQGDITAAIALVETESVEQTGPDTIVETGSEDLDLTGLEFDLDVTIQEADNGQSGGPMHFNGQLSFAVSAFSSIIDDTFTLSPVAGTFLDAYDDIYEFSIVNFSVAGTFGNNDTEFTAAFSISGDGTGVTFTEMFDQAIDPFDSDSMLNETESDFISGGVTLMFTADLAGLTLPGDDGTVEFEVTRTGLDDISSSAEITYPGNMLVFEATATSLETDSSAVATATVTNQDGVVISLDFDDSAASEDDEMSGTIELDGEVFADIELVEGIAMVFYVDGTFESIY